MAQPAFVTVFHARSNTMAQVLFSLGLFQSTYWAVVFVSLAAAVAIVFLYHPERFTRPRSEAPSTEFVS